MAEARVSKGQECAILTDEITQAWSGMSARPIGEIVAGLLSEPTDDEPK